MTLQIIEREMNMKKNFNPEKYGMVICSSCKGNGFNQNPKGQCCIICGGFGFVIKRDSKMNKGRVIDGIVEAFN